MLNILIVDDERDWLRGLKRTLYSHQITGRDKIHLAENGRQMFEILGKQKIDMIVLDLFLDNENGEDLLEQILAADPDQYVVFITGSNSVEHAVECMKKGAKDYLVKSTLVSELVTNFRRIAKIRELEVENRQIKNRALSRDSYPEFTDYLTGSPEVLSIFDYVRAMRNSSQHLLITGESGTGKGVLAKLAAKVLRPDKPFISINVAGYDDQMFADALFGHLKGAFTSAERPREGMIRQAAGGVLFLDEIGDLSPQSQVKLLHLLQEGQFQPLGSDEILRAEVKFIFASNQDLARKLRDGELRSDLFYRLNTHRIQLPPLRERPEDIALLAAHFANEAASELKKAQPLLAPELLAMLRVHPLPGNIRQLRSIIYDLVMRCEGVVDASCLKQLGHLEDGIEPDASETLGGKEEIPTVQELTDRLILKALEKSGGNQVRAAQMLNISQPTLSRKLKKMRASGMQDRLAR